MVEFGGPGPDETHARSPWWRRSAGLPEPRIGWALAVLGAAALFASLAGEWATTTLQYSETNFDESYVVGAGTAGNWGAVWLIGALALAAVVGVCLAGPAHVRAAARAAGLATASALLLIMVAATITISGEGLAYDRLNVVSTEVETEVSLGRGLFAAYATLGLLAAVLWLSAGRPRTGMDAPDPDGSRQPAGTPPTSGADLTVQPAEPFIHPTSDHEWR